MAEFCKVKMDVKNKQLDFVSCNFGLKHTCDLKWNSRGTIVWFWNHAISKDSKDVIPNCTPLSSITITNSEVSNDNPEQKWSQNILFYRPKRLRQNDNYLLSLIQTNQPETKQNKIGNLISFLVVLESFNFFFTCFMQMIRYALSMFILVCSHATLSSAENSLEEILLQYEEYMNVNPDEEIQDSVIPLTSLIDERTLQAKAGKKETVLAELLEPAYRVCFHCR